MCQYFKPVHGLCAWKTGIQSNPKVNKMYWKPEDGKHHDNGCHELGDSTQTFLLALDFSGNFDVLGVLCLKVKIKHGSKGDEILNIVSLLDTFTSNKHYISYSILGLSVPNNYHMLEPLRPQKIHPTGFQK